MSEDKVYKAREARLRRRARSQGLVLEKSRRRNPMAPEHGTYHLLNAYTNYIEVYGSILGFGLNLDDIEKALSS